MERDHINVQLRAYSANGHNLTLTIHAHARGRARVLDSNVLYCVLLVSLLSLLLLILFIFCNPLYHL